MKTISQALQTVLKKHVQFLRGEKGGARANLSGYDLRGYDLRGYDLRGSDLRYSDLRYSDLRYSDLRDSDLRSSDLRGSDLRSSDLRGSDLRGSNLSSSDLRYSDLRGSDLRGSDPPSSDLRYSDLRGVLLVTRATTFLGAVLEILGACPAGVAWVDAQDQSDFNALYNSASRENRQWLSDLLHGEPSALRLLHVFNFAVPLL